MSSCNIIINQQQHEATKIVEVKKKHPGRVAASKRLAQWNRDNQGTLKNKKSIILESLLEEFKRDLNDSAAILIAIEETIRIMKDYKIELCVTLRKM